jgi:type IV pilus biogenesis protein CpaD/CtpE
MPIFTRTVCACALILGAASCGGNDEVTAAPSPADARTDSTIQLDPYDTAVTCFSIAQLMLNGADGDSTADPVIVQEARLMSDNSRIAIEEMADETGKSTDTVEADISAKRALVQSGDQTDFAMNLTACSQRYGSSHFEL